MPERVMPGGNEGRPAAFVLDFDGSVGELPGAVRVPLEDRQETVRFACRRKRLKELERELAPMLDAGPSPVFLGSGDFHHVSFLLIERLRSLGKRIQVVVLDNHPDNMRYPFGIHCGSWVWHASRLPFVARVLVVGVASPDVEGRRILENHLAPLRSGKIVYHCIRRDLRSLRLAGVRGCRSYPSAAELLDALPASLGGAQDPVYLSIDKDVLAEDVVRTNWDQGVFRMEELFRRRANAPRSHPRLRRGRGGVFVPLSKPVQEVPVRPGQAAGDSRRGDGRMEGAAPGGQLGAVVAPFPLAPRAIGERRPDPKEIHPGQPGAV